MLHHLVNAILDRKQVDGIQKICSLTFHHKGIKNMKKFVLSTKICPIISVHYWVNCIFPWTGYLHLCINASVKSLFSYLYSRWCHRQTVLSLLVSNRFLSNNEGATKWIWYLNRELQ